jgi:hypothetical protein
MPTLAHALCHTLYCYSGQSAALACRR